MQMSFLSNKNYNTYFFKYELFDIFEYFARYFNKFFIDVKIPTFFTILNYFLIPIIKTFNFLLVFGVFY